MTDSSGVAITAVLLILIVMDVVGNTLVCLIIKRYLRTKYEKMFFTDLFLPCPSVSEFDFWSFIIWIFHFQIQTSHKLFTSESGHIWYPIRIVHRTKDYRQLQHESPGRIGRCGTLQAFDRWKYSLGCRSFVRCHFGCNCLWKILRSIISHCQRKESFTAQTEGKSFRQPWKTNGHLKMSKICQSYSKCASINLATGPSNCQSLGKELRITLNSP